MCDSESCSDCKLEFIEKKWTEILLNWLSKCVVKNKLRKLTYGCLLDVTSKYQNDLRYSELEQAMLCAQDLEPFLEYNYPILRLRNLCEPADIPKKIYIMSSVLLYYCCMRSKTGQVDADILEKLTIEEQEIILKFCESLNKMETTVYNVESAIRAACEDLYEKLKGENRKHFGVPKSRNPVAPLASNSSDMSQILDKKALQFKSSISVLPSVITDVSRFSENSSSDSTDVVESAKYEQIMTASSNYRDDGGFRYRQVDFTEVMETKDSEPSCPVDYSCAGCIPSNQCCADTRQVNTADDTKEKKTKKHSSWKIYGIITAATILLIVPTFTIPFLASISNKKAKTVAFTLSSPNVADWFWECREKFCYKIYNKRNSTIYSSFGRCSLLCMGPQLWPYPIGSFYFSKSLVAITKRKLKYKFQSPSDSVNEYIAEAFKYFLKNLIRLDKSDLNSTEHDLIPQKLNIILNVESDTDPKLRLNTDESYTVNIAYDDEVSIKINSVSFSGVRHGLETLSQLIVLDETTGYLLTLTNVVVKDSPSYKYRGLMIDTGRNFMPMVDLVRTIDAMSMCKLNTFHWRISDVTSFPLRLSNDKINKYGPYDRHMVYRKEDVASLVKRATVRGIRILIEVAAPGPVGRPWSMVPDIICGRNNDTCNKILCLRLSMKDSIFDILQDIYSDIIEMTGIEDIFHLSDGIFSLGNCFDLLDDREGFLDKALVRLKLANRGFLPKLPIIWYTPHLLRETEMKAWDRFGVQVYNWDPISSSDLSRFHVIYSTKWDLSCEMRKNRCIKYWSWQEMYAWKSWRNNEVFTIEGGESILWTDLVDSGNLDYHLWPRAAVVAERLWSDVVASSSADVQVYTRLDMHRWRMLLRGIRVQSIWPPQCKNNPRSCINKIRK